MLPLPLRKSTAIKLMRLFPQELRGAAIELLEMECGISLEHDSQDPEVIERVRCAALKLSGGSLDRLKAQVRLANHDWRDLLVAADFANDTRAHIAWLEAG